MLAFTSDRPARAERTRGKWTALMLALFVNVLFVAVLVFSVSWQSRQPEAVTAGLYAPVPPPAPQPKARPAPPPQPPRVAPEPPQAEPPPAPKPPAVEQPDTRDAD